MKDSRDRISFTLLDNLLLNSGYSSVIKDSVSGPPIVHIQWWHNSRFQVFDRSNNGLAEPIQLSASQTPFESLTDIGTFEPKGDIIPFVGHRFLRSRERKVVVAERGDIPLS